MNEKGTVIKRFIFTGTPGSGKTSVIQALKNRDYNVIPEAATDVIAREQANGIERPWDSPEFIDHIIHLQKERQIGAKGALQFYDRAPFCTYALLTYLAQWKNSEYVPSPALLDEISRCLKNGVYQNTVFFFENLGFIEKTSARQISFEEAMIFEKIHLDVYQQYGFDVVMVTKEMTVEQRCDCILKKLFLL